MFRIITVTVTVEMTKNLSIKLLFSVNNQMNICFKFKCRPNYFKLGTFKYSDLFYITT